MKNPPRSLSRREFMVRGALATGALFGAPMILPSRVLGDVTRAAANSRLGVGLIGNGLIMKQVHRKPLSTHKLTQPIVVCDVKQWCVDEALEELRPKFPDVVGTREYEEVLANPAVDVVFICTPDHWHAAIAIAAMKAGKDVYVEKPMTLTIEEGKAMIAAEKKYNRILQVGSQQRSDRHFRNAANIVRNGWIGEVRDVYCRLGDFPQPPENEIIVPVPEGFDYDRWLGPTPFFEYSDHRVEGTYKGGWRCYWEYGGRKFGDWGAHHFDIVQWALDRDETGPVEFIPKGFEGATHHHYRYADGITVYRDRKPAKGEGIEVPSKNNPEVMEPADHMIWFMGTEGKLGVSRGGKLDVIPEKYSRHRFTPKESIVYESTSHRDNFLECVQSRKAPICPAGVGHRTASICHLAAIAKRLGRPVKWDPAAEMVIGDAEAAGMQDRPRRPGYEMPAV